MALAIISGYVLPGQVPVGTVCGIDEAEELSMLGIATAEEHTRFGMAMAEEHAKFALETLGVILGAKQV